MSRTPILSYVVAVVTAVLFLAPLAVALMTSLKSPSELTQVLRLPTDLYFENYARAWQQMGRTFLNSLLITGPSVVFSILVGTMAAYPLAFVRAFGGHRLLSAADRYAGALPDRADSAVSHHPLAGAL